MAQPEYGITASPCANLNATALLGEKPGDRDVTLSNDEIFALWRASMRIPYPVGPVYRLLLLTGLRLREAANARWHEFDLDKCEWTIPAARMKGKNAGPKQSRPHVVPLTNELLALVKEVAEKRGKGAFVFSTTGGRVPVWMGAKVKDDLDHRMLITLRALARMRGKALPKTITHFVNHDIRRTVRTHLAKLKISEEAREALLAHRQPTIKGVYNRHDYFDEKREALQEWAARLRTIVEPAPNNVVSLQAAMNE